MRGSRKRNGRYIFIPPASAKEADSRRTEAIRELSKVNKEIDLLSSQKKDLAAELSNLNRVLRSQNFEQEDVEDNFSELA